MALTSKLSAIGDAIREKTGTTELLTLDAMPTAIKGITTGGYDIPDEAFAFSGECEYAFANTHNDWLLESYGDRVITDGITNGNYMFSDSEARSITFDLNFSNEDTVLVNGLFYNCQSLMDIGKIKNLYPKGMGDMFWHCYDLRYLPEFENLDMSYMNSSTNSMDCMFVHCDSLRSIPEEFLKQMHSKTTTKTSVFPYCTFQSCYSLDEVIGFSPISPTRTSNVFTTTVSGCCRLKNMIFDTQDDKVPFEVNWKNQTIDCADIGYASQNWMIVGKNNGITADKEVVDDATYQALKDDPDWFTCDVAYSRYNHDSAVNTINSLPDTSAYLSTQTSGTNTISFLGESGSATDGGAINTLTEEEIAVAVAKGWTVSFV